MARYVVNDTELISVADTIRTKGNTSAQLEWPIGYIEAINDFQIGDIGHEQEDGVISRTISSYTNDTVKSIGDYAFASYYSLTTVSFPACTTIGNNAFNNCTKLTTVSFPACTTISDFAFVSCSSLTTVSFPECTTIGNFAFEYCTNLTTVSFPACTTIGSNAFSNCTKLTTVSFPACTTIGSNAFAYCYSLTTVSFPACTTISGSFNFRGCLRLLSAYFLGSSVPKLTYSNAFSSTPIGGYTAFTQGISGSIFVRVSLLTQFRSAANWKYYSSRMVGLTDEEIATLNT